MFSYFGNKNIPMIVLCFVRKLWCQSSVLRFGGGVIMLGREPLILRLKVI